MFVQIIVLYDVRFGHTTRARYAKCIYLSFSSSSSSLVRRIVVYEHLPFAETHTKITYIKYQFWLGVVVVVVIADGEYPYSWQ